MSKVSVSLSLASVSMFIYCVITFLSKVLWKFALNASWGLNDVFQLAKMDIIQNVKKHTFFLIITFEIHSIDEDHFCIVIYCIWGEQIQYLIVCVIRHNSVDLCYSPYLVVDQVILFHF